MTEQNNHLEGLDMERLFTDTQFDAVITVAGDVDVTAPMVTKIVAQVTDGDEYVLHGYSSLEQGKVRLGFLTKENAKIASEKLNTVEHNKPLLNDDGTYRPMNIMELTFNKVTEVTFIDHTLL